MLKERVITALILLTIFFVTLIASSSIYFGLLTLSFVAIGAWEWGRLSGYLEGMSCALAALVMGICGILWGFNLIHKIPSGVWFCIAILWFFFVVWLLKGGTARWQKIPAKFRWAAGVIILSSAWCALWLMKMQGNNFLLSVLFLVWIADTGAYFSGKKFGKHKLAPTISPGKSWEGVYGGLLAVILLACSWMIFDLYAGLASNGGSFFTQLDNHGNMLLMLFAVIFLTLLGIMGDLCESLMKRSVGLKDSSHVLPGHGGVLDRVDALLPVLPFVAAFVSIL